MIDLAAALYLLLAATGLALSVSYAGLPVLGQGAFVAVGGFGTALLGPGGAGLPLGLAVVAAVVLAGLVGALVALGASRLQGASLALATWGLAWLVFRALQAFPSVSGGEQGLVRPAPARLVTATLGLSVTLSPAVHVLLAGLLCAGALLALRRLDRGPAGLDLAALREGPALAVSLGIPVAARRRAVLVVTAVLGGLSGAGTCVLLGLVAPADVSPLLSLQLFVAVLLGGTAHWWGPVVGVVVLSLLPPLADALATVAGLSPERLRGALTAALLVAVLALRAPAGRLLARARPSPEADGRTAQGTPSGAAGGRPARQVAGAEVLRAQGVQVAYGAVQALGGVDLALRAGQVHALVGPNGSGKSTLLAVLAGDVRPHAGRVEVDGRPAGDGPGARVRAGVARTPQRTVVLPGATPARQVAVGARGGTRGGVARHLLATPSSEPGTTDLAVVLSGAQGSYQGGGVELPADSNVGEIMRQIRWATPERLSRERPTPARVSLAKFLADHGLGVLVSSEGPTLNALVGVGVAASRRPFTYPQVMQLVELAAIIENALERANLSAKAALTDPAQRYRAQLQARFPDSEEARQLAAHAPA